MARRDPARAIRELRGEADGNPLLAHLPQERKDALIRQAQLRQTSHAMSRNRRQQEQARRASDVRALPERVTRALRFAVN